MKSAWTLGLLFAVEASAPAQQVQSAQAVGAVELAHQGVVAALALPAQHAERDRELADAVRTLISAVRDAPESIEVLGTARRQLWAAGVFSLAVQVGVKHAELSAGSPAIARQVVRDLEKLVRGEPEVDAFAAVQVWFYVAEFSIRGWELARADDALDRLRSLLPDLREVWPAGIARSEAMAQGLATRLDTARGRPRSALRNGFAAVQAAEEIQATAAGQRVWIEAQLDLADAALAARLPGLADEGLQAALAVTTDSKLRVLLLARRASALSALGKKGEEVLAASAQALAEPGCRGHLRIGCLLQRSQWLWRAGLRAEARTQLAEARQLSAAPSGSRGALRVADGLVLSALEMRMAEGRSPGKQRAALARLETAFDQLLNGWNRSRDLARRRGVGFLHYGSRRMVLGELVRWTMVLVPGETGLRRALRYVVRARAFGSIAGAAGLGGDVLDPARLDAMVGAVCPPEGGLLIYSRGETQLRVFAVDRERIASFEVTGTDQKPLAPAKATNLPLPAACLAWIRDRQWRAVTVTGWSDLGELEPRAPHGPWPIAVLPSLWVGAILAARDGRFHAGATIASRPATDAPLDLLVLAGDQPAQRTKSASFDLSPADLDALLLGVHPKRVRVLRGALAVPEAIRRNPLGSARALVVLAHGVREAKTGGTRLALAAGSGGPWLSAYRLRRLVAHAGDLPRLPPLVVLLACDAGRTPSLVGEDGGQDLATACLEAGAQTVLLATDRIALRRALDFCGPLGRALQAGQSPAAAVHRLREQVDARVRIVGDGHRPVF